MSLWAELFQTHVSPKYEKVSRSARKNHRISFSLSVAEALLIPQKPSAMVSQIHGQMSGTFFSKTEIPNACIPIGAIPTIAASGSEMSGSCVITNEDGWLKRGSTRSDLCRPKFTLMNPRLTYTSTGISDRKWLCGHSHAYHGTLFCQYRNHGDH